MNKNLSHNCAFNFSRLFVPRDPRDPSQLLSLASLIPSYDYMDDIFFLRFSFFHFFFFYKSRQRVLKRVDPCVKAENMKVAEIFNDLAITKAAKV